IVSLMFEISKIYKMKGQQCCLTSFNDFLLGFGTAFRFDFGEAPEEMKMKFLFTVQQLGIRNCKDPEFSVLGKEITQDMKKEPDPYLDEDYVERCLLAGKLLKETDCSIVSSIFAESRIHGTGGEQCSHQTSFNNFLLGFGTAVRFDFGDACEEMKNRFLYSVQQLGVRLLNNVNFSVLRKELIQEMMKEPEPCLDQTYIKNCLIAGKLSKEDAFLTLSKKAIEVVTIDSSDSESNDMESPPKRIRETCVIPADPHRWWEKLMPDSVRSRCRNPKCTFTKEAHPPHLPPNGNSPLSLLEMRILIKWLYQSGNLNSRGSNKTYGTMHLQGHLTHRSPESLRNCVRRTIPNNLAKLELPKSLKYYFQHKKPA
ncbi:hypothetical protein QAD02_010350, partial [Eretmocerus hayati]